MSAASRASCSGLSRDATSFGIKTGEPKTSARTHAQHPAHLWLAAFNCRVNRGSRHPRVVESGPSQRHPTGASAKPKIAVFPLAGDMSEDAREKCGFALRKKLDRDGAYEPVAGPDMKDLVADVDPPVGFDTPVER